MKTSEFVKKMEGFGFSVAEEETRVLVTLKDESIVVIVDTKNYATADSRWDAFSDILDAGKKKEIMEIVFEYIVTPIEDRVDVKKYYLRLPSAHSQYSSYLNFSAQEGTYIFGSNVKSLGWKIQFTEEEIGKLPNQSFIKSLTREEVE